MSHKLIVSPRIGAVTVSLSHPKRPRALWILAHGAGAGMDHPFLVGLSAAAAEEGIATWRYQFPYMERGSKRPDPPAVLMATVRANTQEAERAYPQLPVFAGGKSMGGRMTAEAHVREALPSVRGLIFVGYPLVPIGGGPSREAPLLACKLPMLFLQGTRDKLAPYALMQGLMERLGERAAMHVVEGADHSFAVPKRLGRSDTSVLAELARVAGDWMRSHE